MEEREAEGEKGGGGGNGGERSRSLSSGRRRSSSRRNRSRPVTARRGVAATEEAEVRGWMSMKSYGRQDPKPIAVSLLRQMRQVTR